MQFEFNVEYARAQDQADPLKRFRDEFHIPMINGKPAVYFTGNSLGLQPKKTQHYLNEELENLLKSNKEFDFTRQIKLQLLHSVLLILNSICKNDGMDFYTKRKEIKFIVNQPKLTQVFSNLSLKNQRKSLKLILFFIKHKMAFMYLFYFRIITLLKNA